MSQFEEPAHPERNALSMQNEKKETETGGVEEQEAPSAQTPGTYGMPAENFGYYPPEVYEQPASEQGGERYEQPPYQEQRPPFYQQERQRPPFGRALQNLWGQYKLVLLKPKKESFDAQLGLESWSMVLVQIGIQAIVTALYTIVICLGIRAIVLGFIPSNAVSSGGSARDVFNNAFSTPLIASASVIAVLLVPINIFIINGIQYLMARIFKGRGSFLEQTYTYMLHVTPVIILTAIAFLPMLISPLVGIVTGSLVSVGLGLYNWYLLVMQIQSVHRFSINRALGVVFIPYAILYTIYIILYFTIYILTFAAAFGVGVR